MADYTAPIKELTFTLDHVVGAERLAELAPFSEVSSDLTGAVLEEAGKFARDVLAPLNAVGDRQGSRFEHGEVQTPDGFAAAYSQFVAAGWNGISGPTAFGGQGLPVTLATAVIEMMTAANIGWALCPLLNQSAIVALAAHASDAQKELFLHKIVSGEWCATMNLTEPQAGTDVGALATRAAPQTDGSYRITGQKIFISYGDHDMAENIVHLVLARTPGAPAGTRGISLFLVPKFLVEEGGALGARNDLRCISLERKLGIHASPTCVMSFGDEGACVGYLLGEENGGMRCMFTMMNTARLHVGVQGLAVGERAYQQALAYAQERRQGRASGQDGDGPSPIIAHADVRRMLLTMKSQIAAARAIALKTAFHIDLGDHHPDDETRAHHAAMAAFLTPIAKAWCSDIGVEVASLGIQIHGGMGYVEETGAAQYFRDARITPIYEGTNGIQGADLVMRKLNLQNGGIANDLIAEMREAAESWETAGDSGRKQSILAAALDGLAETCRHVRERIPEHPRQALAAATPLLRQWGYALGGALLAKGAAAAQAQLEQDGADRAFLEAQIVTARFYTNHLLPLADAQMSAILSGDDDLFAMEPEQFGP